MADGEGMMDDLMDYILIGCGIMFILLAVAVEACFYGGILYLLYLLVKWVTT